MFDPDDPGAARWVAETRKVGATLKLELVERLVGNERAIERVFQTLKPGDVEGLLVASPHLRVKFHSVILRLASARRLPMVGHRREWVEQGALFSYADNVRKIGRAAVTRYIDRILTGAKPADLPVEEISEFELVINLKTAKALGLTIPPALLQRADQVIE